MEKDIGLGRLRGAVMDAGTCVPSVSKWSIGMHVHHCCLVIVGISRSLAASKPPPPRVRRSLLASFLLRIGRIPRGRAKTAEAALPRGDVSPPELLELLEKSEQLLAEVDRLGPQCWFKHFAFGVLDRDEAVHFIRMHNRHHLRIISDILAAHR